MSNSLVTPWTVARQASLSMGFSRWEYWSGLLFPYPGITPASPALAGGFFTTEPPWKKPNENLIPSGVRTGNTYQGVKVLWRKKKQGKGVGLSGFSIFTDVELC